jgi:hypothetical protein
MLMQRISMDRRVRRAAVFAAAAAALPAADVSLPQNPQQVMRTLTVYPGAKAGRIYCITVAAQRRAEVRGRTLAEVMDGSGPAAAKILHMGDRDWTVLVRPRVDGPLRVALKPEHGDGFVCDASAAPVDASTVPQCAAEPNNTPSEAQEFVLGTPVVGLGDTTPYIPPDPDERTHYIDAARQTDQLAAASRKDGDPDWLQFNLKSEGKRLVSFELDIPDRDQIACDISIFRKDGTLLEPVLEGSDPVTPPHEIQSLPGNKYTTRVLSPGRYLVRVTAHHPLWMLKSQVLQPPPYTNPRMAVRTAVDYLLGAGDSWHSNTPRAGTRLHRAGNVHTETAQCVACHPTQFTTRAALAAAAAGYRPQRMECLEFLTERMANNPRPFYGHPKAGWARMISAAANVTGRVADLVALYGAQFGRSVPESVHTAAYHYLKLYYKGRREIPEDETNGNQPLVSRYEVLYHALKVVRREAERKGGDPDAAELAASLNAMIGQDRVKNQIDLCWQMIAAAELSQPRLQSLVDRNVERILSLQTADGQWTVPLDKPGAPVEFQTYHALYALAAAGIKHDDPRTATALRRLLSRQQEWGGWFDPQQSFENFRTPFRETQFAVMALSRWFPEDRSRHSAASAFETIEGTSLPSSATPHTLQGHNPLLQSLAWRHAERSGAPVHEKQVLTAAQSPSKVVRRAVARCLRSRMNIGTMYTTWQRLMQLGGDAQWTGLQTVAQHFRAAAEQPALLPFVLKAAQDSDPICRMSACQTLWQLFWWTPHSDDRAAILDAVLSVLTRKREHPWVLRNAREALYNMADENTRYLYNNWIPLLAAEEDRTAAKQAQQAQDRMTADKIAAALDRADTSGRIQILLAVTEFHLRRVREQNLRYARIGNDIEQIKFSPSAAGAFSQALNGCLQDPNPVIRRLAATASLILRDGGAERTTLSAAKLLADPEPTVRHAAEEAVASLPKISPANIETAEYLLSQLIDSGTDEAARFSTNLLTGKNGAQLAASAKIAKSVLTRLKQTPNSHTTRLLGALPQLHIEPAAHNYLERALRQPDPSEAAALVFRSTLLFESRGLAGAWTAALERDRTSTLKRLLEVLHASPELSATVRGAALTADILNSERDEQILEAMELASKTPSLRSAAAVRSALHHLTRNDNRSIAARAEAVLSGQNELAATALPDEAYFTRNVLPLFAAKSAQDGQACVSCHFNHNLFALDRPSAEGTFTEVQARNAYRSALKVVNLQNPEASLLLQKPLSSSQTEGLVRTDVTAHGGGVRWTGRSDTAYRTVLAWIKGARDTR